MVCRLRAHNPGWGGSEFSEPSQPGFSESLNTEVGVTLRVQGAGSEKEKEKEKEK